MSATRTEIQAPAAQRRRAMALMFACTVIGTLAQLLMKTGMARFSPDHLAAVITNYTLIAGYALYGVNTLLMVLALREGELSILYPIIALTYVWTTIACYMGFLVPEEPPNLFKNLGILLIIAGVAVIGRGSKK